MVERGEETTPPRQPPATDADGMLGRLIDESHLVAPDELGALVARVVRRLPAREAVVYLASMEQRHLQPLPGTGVPWREPIDIDATLAGRAFRTLTWLRTDADGGDSRVWLPLLDGTSRLGVLELVVDQVDEARIARCRQLAGLVAELVAGRDQYGDAFRRLRRRKPLSLAAEMQWSLLPPLTFSDGRLTISGVLEPAYQVAGDTFDYAFNGDTAHVAIIDAMGHGFEATVLASVAVAAYRHSRRAGHDLAATYAAMDAAVAGQFGPDRFVTAQLAELDATTGQVVWLNAGHPAPMLVRGGRMVGFLECAPTLPVGFGGAVAEIASTELEPDDQLLWYTDGVIEARAANGEFFGEDRLADLLTRATTSGLPSPEIARRLAHAILQHQEGDLQDDATTLLVRWHGREPIDFRLEGDDMGPA